MKKVMTFGSFDGLHKGHEHYLKEAKSYGNYLIVVVARDVNIVKFKQRKPQHDENDRLLQVKILDFVDEAILGHEWNITQVLEEYKPDVVCLGYDQKTLSEESINKELKKINSKAKIVRAKAFKPENYKSSKLNK